MSTSNNDASVQDIKNKLEDYRTTILALQCFAGAATWDNSTQKKAVGAKDSMGRRMHTSNRNRIVKLEEITPDSVIQRNQQLGYIVEAKKSVPRDQGHWKDIFKQLEKYDDDLTGWWYEPISESCIVLLMHITRTADFRKYMMELINRGELTFHKPVSLIEFNRSSEGKEYLFLRYSWGQIKDDGFAAELESGKSVPIENVLSSSRERKFYDAPPEIEHTMCILWQDIFTAMKSEVKYDESRRAYPLDVDAANLTHELQQLYGSIGEEEREVQFPQVAWVQNALNALVSLKLATKGSANGHYTILFRKLNGDLIERFVKHRDIVGKVENQGNQLNLFET